MSGAAHCSQWCFHVNTASQHRTASLRSSGLRYPIELPFSVLQLSALELRAVSRIILSEIDEVYGAMHWRYSRFFARPECSEYGGLSVGQSSTLPCVNEISYFCYQVTIRKAMNKVTLLVPLELDSDAY